MDNDQAEIARLKQEVERLRAKLEAASIPVRSDTTSLINNHELIQNLARYAEDLLSEHDIKKKYRFDNATWTQLCTDEKFIEAVEIERIRRTRLGLTARERAQKLFTETPTVLGNILHDETKPSRHRIEAAKEIRAVAATGPDAASASEEKFSIVINLGEDYKLVVDKPIQPTPNDSNTIDSTAQELLPVIAAKNREGNGGNGEPI
jgi:hypothetical protein